MIHTLAKCEWVQKGQPLCPIGDSGTGKSHLLIALGTEAAMAGWLSVNSFGPPLILVGLMVLWLNHLAMTPPSFIAWSIIAWFVVGEVAAGPGIDQDLIILTAAVLLLASSRAHSSDSSYTSVNGVFGTMLFGGTGDRDL